MFYEEVQLQLVDITKLTEFGRRRMDKNCIDRKALRYNFLKKIIIRFDYDGMDDTELDQVISGISLELKKHNYASRTVESEKEVQFEFNDPESGDYAELYGKKIREQLLNKEEIKAKMMELTYIQGRLAEE